MSKYVVVNANPTFGISREFNTIEGAQRFARAERLEVGGDVSIYLTVEEALRRGLPTAEHHRYLTHKQQDLE